MTYELTELTDDEFAIETTVDAPIDTEFAGTRVTGTIAGSGEFRGSRSKPLVLDGTYTQDSDMSLGDEGDMTTRLVAEMTSE